MKTTSLSSAKSPAEEVEWSTVDSWMSPCFFLLYILYIYIYFFFRGFEMLGLKPFLELWVTELYLRFFFFLAAGSRHLLVQNPWGLDRQFARLF